MPLGGIVAGFDTQLLLWVDLVGGADVAGGHGLHKLHVPASSCSQAVGGQEPLQQTVQMAVRLRMILLVTCLTMLLLDGVPLLSRRHWEW